MKKNYTTFQWSWEVSLDKFAFSATSFIHEYGFSAFPHWDSAFPKTDIARVIRENKVENAKVRCFVNSYPEPGSLYLDIILTGERPMTEYEIKSKAKKVARKEREEKALLKTLKAKYESKKQRVLRDAGLVKSNDPLGRDR